MKKLVSFVILIISVSIALFTSCDGAKNKYAINGTVADSTLNGELIYLIDFNDGQVVDSVIITDGKFTFKSITDGAIARNIRVRNLSADIIVDKGSNITVEITEPFSAKGNALTEQLNEFASKFAEIMNETREKLMQLDDSIPAEEAAIIQETIINDYTSKLNDLSAQYLKDHPNDILGALVFVNQMQNQATSPSASAFNDAKKDLGEIVLNFGPVKKMAEHFEKLDGTAEGQMFTDFTIENGNLDNTPASFSNYIGKGKYILVDFWASWCGPCRREIPNLKEVYNKYKGDKFDILGVAVWDKRDETLKAMEEEGTKWPQIIDAQTIPTELYGIEGIPHIILFAPDGTIVARDLRGAKIGQKIAEVLKQ
jgi:thiol-disulfide isomerase/thioredoxin